MPREPVTQDKHARLISRLCHFGACEDFCSDPELIQEAVDALTALQRTEWQDISTAPKDGERILGAQFDEIAHEWRVYSMFWNAHFDDGLWQHGGLKEHPRKWRPLPAAPVLAEKRGE